jgi:hypothetical protein
MDEGRLTSPIVGPCATATLLPILDAPEWSATTCHWLIASAQFHVWWRQWLVACVDLAPNNVHHPAALHFPGATHEVIIVAVNPDHPVTPADTTAAGFQLQFLTPINLAAQFEASDEEMRRVVAYMCWSISEGHHTPEPPLSHGIDSEWGQGWLASITKTLAHVRGEVHAP